MKKLVFTAALAVFCLFGLHAQDAPASGFSQGDVFVSGTVGFVTSTQDERTSNSLDFSPSVGYFLTENIAGELTLLIGSNSLEEGTFESTDSRFGASLGATYFFTPADKFSFTTGANLFYISGSNEINGEEGVDVNTFGVAIAPGVNYFISNNFALRAAIGALSYQSTKADFDGAEAENTFALNMDLSDIRFGLLYRF